MSVKALSLLKEIVPGLNLHRRLVNPGNSPTVREPVWQALNGALQQGLGADANSVREPMPILPSATIGEGKDPMAAFASLADELVYAHLDEIIAFGRRERLPFFDTSRSP